MITRSYVRIYSFKQLLERTKSWQVYLLFAGLKIAWGEEKAIAIYEVLVDSFIALFSNPPKDLILDFDITDNAVHGRQEGRFFHGYYDHYCFPPLYVFCGDQLLVSYLRPSKIDGAKHSWAILLLLVKQFRQVWPEVKNIRCQPQRILCKKNDLQLDGIHVCTDIIERSIETLGLEGSYAALNG